jgi:hypothetical protein
MAREAYRSLYGDLTKLKDSSPLDNPAAGSGDDNELFQLLLAVSASVDGYCNRHFYALTATRRFDGPADPQLTVPDLVSVTSLKSDDDDGAFETTWATTDYELLPLNAEPTQPWGVPHHSLRVLSRGTKQQFDRGQARFEIEGVWGYRSYQEASGSLTDGAVADASTTSVTVDSGTDFAIAQTVAIESEQLLVIAITTNTLTVRRGLNGTTAASHADNTQVDIMRWPAAVERATLINAARIWTRAPVFEPFYVDVDLDSDVRMMLDTFRLAAASGGGGSPPARP